MKPSISMETGPSSSSSFEVKQQNNLNSGLLDKSASSLKLGASGSQMSLSNNMQKQMAPVPVQQVCYIILSRPSVIKCISFISTQSQSHKPQQKRTEPSPGKEDASEGDDEEHEESYENLEGAYNAKDYLNLDVTAEVKDLFQYIERYRPQEVELASTLKCFIPEYIPAIGEMDAFIKVCIL